jgi:peptide/nickel transport system substrate-binding protein
MVRSDKDGNPFERVDDITPTDLSGPKVDRRTAMKLLSAAGLAGLAGCTGNEGGDGETTSTTDDEGGDSGDDTTTGNQQQMGGRASAIWHIAGIQNLDPAYADHGHYVMLLVNIFDGLIKMNDNFEFEPDLAEDWSVSEDGTTFTFELRDDVTFHNGDQFTAEDVRFTLQRNVENEAPAASFIQDAIVNPADGGVVVQDDYTVEINWTEPFAPGLAYMTRGPGRVATPINQNALEEMGRQQYTLTPVGTGPFEVTEHVTNESLTLEKYDDYHRTDADGNSLPYLDGIDISIVSEVSTATSAIQSGDVHMLNVIPGQSVSTLEGDSAISTDRRSMPGWFGLEMNMTKEPFSSRKFRRGIAKMIDGQAFVESALFGNAIFDTGPLSPVHIGRDDKPSDQEYAPEEGAQLVRESGYEGVEFNILTRGTDTRQGRVLRQQLNRVGVVSPQVQEVPAAEFGKRINNQTFDTWIGGQLLSVDAELSLKPFYMPDGIWNWTGYADDQVEELLVEQSSVMDPEERKEILWQVEDKVIADAPHAYLCHPSDWMGVRNELQEVGHPPVLRLFHEASLQS